MQGAFPDRRQPLQMSEGSDQRYYCCPEHVKQPHAVHLSHTGRQPVRYRARAFNSDCHPFEVGRSAIRVRAKYGYLLPPDLSTDGSCSSPSSQSSSLAPAIIGSSKVRGLLSLLSETCANVVASASARIAEHFRQLLDPVVPASGTGIEIEGLGRRLARDAHAEPDSDVSTTHVSSKRRSFLALAYLR